MSGQDGFDLSGLEKACILLMSYGTTVAAEVFKHLTEPEIEQISGAIVRMQNVDATLMGSVLSEFDSITSGASGSVSGKNFAAQVLEQAMGSEKASQMLDRANTPGKGRPFGSLWDLNPTQFSRVLSDEHPQIAALVLTYLPAAKSAAVLAELEPGLQAEVAHRICTLEEADPEVLVAIEETLQAKLNATSTQQTASGGPKTLVDILNNAERATEQNILNSLAENDPEVGEQVRDLMFTFEDLPKLEDRTVQLVLREVDQEDLRLALKGASDEIQQLVFKNMSERAAEMLREDLELVGNARQKDVETSQQKLVLVVRRLIATGEASLKEEGAETKTSEEDELAGWGELGDFAMAAEAAESGETSEGAGETDEQPDQEVDLAA